MIEEYFIIAFRNIIHRRLRSWLTILSIIIGIIAVVSLISIGKGMEMAVNEQFEILGSDSITIMPGSGGISGPMMSSGTFSDSDLNAIRRIPGVETVSGMIFEQTFVEFHGEKISTYVMGVDTDLMDIIQDMPGFEVETGRLFRSSDKYKAGVGFLYPEGKVFEDKVDLRNKIKIKEHEFTVIATMTEVGNSQDDAQIFIPLETAREIFEKPEGVGFVWVKVTDESIVDRVADDITDDLEDQRGEEDFSVMTSQQLSDTVGSILGIIQIVLIGIASVSLLVGGIGIMNTMYTSVIERTREIGIMKAVGARNNDISLIFLIESGFLGMVGGIVGTAIGLGLAKAVEYGAAESGFPLLKAYLGIELILFALAFSFGLGMLSGFLPARQAASLKPADALRYE